MQNTLLKPEDSYYGHLRRPVLSLITGTPKRVLEIGCGHGQLLRFLKRERSATFVAGMELVPEVADAARRRPEVDLVLTGDIEQGKLDFPDGYFDLIIASHVLEHVKDPWAVTRRIYSLLNPAGQFVGSIPNVRHAKVSLPLVLWGKFEYTEQGIMDWTHTKFFTESTIRQLLTSSGFKVEKMEPELFRRSAIVNRVTLGMLKHLLCFTYNFSARPAPIPTAVTGRWR